MRRMLPSIGEPEVCVEVSVYAAGAETLLARIQALPDEVDEVMLVGHNPGLMEVLVLLAAPGRLRERAATNVPTGALAELEAEVVRWADVLQLPDTGGNTALPGVQSGRPSSVDARSEHRRDALDSEEQSQQDNELH